MAVTLAALRRAGLGPALAAEVLPPILLHEATLPATVVPPGGTDDPKDMEGYADADVPPLHLQRPVADGYLASQLTALVFTSPVPSHPCPEMILAVIESFKFIPGLAECRLIVTCDGPGRLSETVRPKRGQLTPELLEKYGEFIQRLGPALRRRGAEMLVLPERVGFGIAVRKALELVSTPYVMICQHDNIFVRPVDVSAVVRVMDANSDILKCVHFVSPKTSFDDGDGQVPGLKKVEDRLGRIAGGHVQFSETPHASPLDFWPMPSWLERNHVCSTGHYRDFVLGTGTRLKPGQFIEETFGQKMRADLAAGGSHQKYGIFRLLDNPASATSHIDGRGYRTVKECLQRGWRPCAPFERLEQEHQAWLAGLGQA